MMIERPRRRGYQLHAPDSLEAEALLIERGLTRTDLNRALAALDCIEGIAIRTIAGINDNGVFGSRRSAGGLTFPRRTPNRSSPSCGSRSWSCSAYAQG